MLGNHPTKCMYYISIYILYTFLCLLGLLVSINVNVLQAWESMAFSPAWAVSLEYRLASYRQTPGLVTSKKLLIRWLLPYQASWKELWLKASEKFWLSRMASAVCLLATKLLNPCSFSSPSLARSSLKSLPSMGLLTTCSVLYNVGWRQDQTQWPWCACLGWWCTSWPNSCTCPPSWMGL